MAWGLGGFDSLRRFFFFFLGGGGFRARIFGFVSFLLVLGVRAV